MGGTDGEGFSGKATIVVGVDDVVVEVGGVVGDDGETGGGGDGGGVDGPDGVVYGVIDNTFDFKA